MRTKKAIWIFCILLLGGFFAGYKTFSDTSAKDSSADDIKSTIDLIISKRSEAIMKDGKVDFGDATHVNVLLLGLDSRNNGDSLGAHCDAIHLFSLDIVNWNISITSVPRGTYSWIPNGPYAPTDYYLANACAFAGLDYGVTQIENIIGVKADYVVTIGFSEVMGITRLFGLPPTETLQWLRHRQSYQIGDPQRSQNQAVFLKDMIINHLGMLRGVLNVPMQYVIYSMLETDMSFTTARALLNGFTEAKIDERPDDIVLQMRPWYATVDYHFDPENAQAQIQALVDFISPFLSDADLSRATTEQVQEALISGVEAKLISDESLASIISHQLWLQINDDQTREQLQFDIIAAYARELSATDTNTAVDFISDYILEKEALGSDEWAEKGKELFKSVLQ